MVGLDPDADLLAQCVVVVAGDHRQRLATVRQTEGVENVRAAKRLVQYPGLERARVVMDDVVRAQQHFHVAGVGTVGAALKALGWQFAGELADADVDSLVFQHDAGNEHALADEVGDEAVRRAVIQVVRAIPLGKLTALQDADLVGYGERFGLVMGDQHRGGALLLQDVAYLLPEPLAHLHVQIRERFVQQQQLGARRQRPGQRDALLLTAGQLMRVALARGGQSDHLEQFADPIRTLRGRQCAQAEGDVAGDRKVGKQGVVLEHHADLTLLGRGLLAWPGDLHPVEQDRSASDRFEPGDATKHRRLAAAARTQQTANLPALQRERQAVEHAELAVAVADLIEAQNGIHRGDCGSSRRE